jgi:hypothetical protein
MNLELFLNLYVSIGSFIFLTTFILGHEKVIDIIVPLVSSKLFEFFHHFVFFTIFFGFLLPKRFLKYHLYILLIAFLHWQTNNQECILTQIQQKLIKDKDYGFFKSTIFQNTITKNEAFYISYITFIFSSFITLTKMG